MRIFSLIACLCCLMLTACVGSSSDKTLDPTPPSEQTEAVKDKAEIPLGAPVAHVLKILGPADTTDSAEGGREIWRYSGKKAEYVYVSKSSGVQALVLGSYIREPEAASPGQTLLLTIVFDSAKKVADFNFALMSF